jgi:hypothetical protein
MLKHSKKSILLGMALMASFFGKAQINDPSDKSLLIAGTENKAGAIYRFASVKSGVDALVTLEKISSSLTIRSINTTGYGYAASFSPELNINAGCWGYALFNVQFVKSGTNVPVNFSDIVFDGRKNIKIRYADFDQAAKDVKVSVIKASKSSFRVMMYATNLGTQAIKKSGNVAFRKFTCSNSNLLGPAVTLVGHVRDSLVQIKWQVKESDAVSSMILEKSYDGTDYQNVNEYWANSQMDGLKFSYLGWVNQSMVYYRLKMVSKTGAVQYSNIMNISMTGDSERNAMMGDAALLTKTISEGPSLSVKDSEQQ